MLILLYIETVPCCPRIDTIGKTIAAFTIPFTNISLHITLASLLYSYWAARSPEYFGNVDIKDEKVYKYQARHHILYSVGTMS